MKKIILILSVLALCLGLMACQDINETHSIAISPNVLASYECTVTVTGQASLAGDQAAVFKPGIRPSDITLSDALKGKTVKSVEYVDSGTIRMVLSGKVSLEGDSAYGKVSISKNALENDDPVFGYVLVTKAYIRATSASSSSVSGSGSYTATYELGAGSFTEFATKEHIRIAPDFDGQIETVTLTDNQLTVTVQGASKTPTIIMDACVTDLDKEISISVDISGKAPLE